MKIINLVIIVSFLFTISCFAQVNSSTIDIFAEASVENTHHLIYINKDVKFGVNNSFNMGAEAIIFKTRGLAYSGVGVIYQFPTNIVDQNGSYSFIPLYAFTRIKFIGLDVLNIMLQVKLGYNFISVHNNYLGGSGDDFNGGLYYSVGSIMSISDELQVRLFYSVNYGKYFSYSDYLLKNEQFTIGMGYALNIF